MTTSDNQLYHPLLFPGVILVIFYISFNPMEIHVLQMFGTLLKATSQGYFSSNNFQNVQFPKRQLPKSVPASPLCPIAHPAHSAQPPLHSLELLLGHLEKGHLGNCHLGSHTRENAFANKHNSMSHYPVLLPNLILSHSLQSIYNLIHTIHPKTSFKRSCQLLLYCFVEHTVIFAINEWGLG